jgi:hypothetical protein
LAKIFSRFGDEPTGWIYAGKNRCFIVDPGRKPLEACQVPHGDLAPHVVLLPSDIYKRHEKDRCGTIMLVLHEVAHGYLDHHGNISSKVYRQQELNRWKLAEVVPIERAATARDKVAGRSLCVAPTVGRSSICGQAYLSSSTRAATLSLRCRL